VCCTPLFGTNCSCTAHTVVLWSCVLPGVMSCGVLCPVLCALQVLYLSDVYDHISTVVEDMISLAEDAKDLIDLVRPGGGGGGLFAYCCKLMLRRLLGNWLNCYGTIKGKTPQGRHTSMASIDCCRVYAA
jgi:hypothetical protein